MLDINPAEQTRLMDFLTLVSVNLEAESLRDFLADAADTVQRTLGAREVCLVVGNDDSDATWATTPMAAARALVMELAGRAPLRFEAAGADAVLETWRRALQAAADFDLCLLETGSETVGILGWSGPKSRPDAAEARLMGRALGIAVDNFRAQQETRHHIARQSLLRDIGRLFATGEELDHKVNAFLGRLHLIRPVDACCLTFMDPNDPTGPVRTCHLNDLTHRLNPALQHAVVSELAPLYVEDLLDSFHAEGHPLRSYLGLPLIRREAVTGVLSVGARQPHAFSRRDVEFFVSVSEHIAINVDNASLLEETRQQVHELTFLMNVAGVLRREKTLDGVLRVALEQCVQLLGAGQGWMFMAEESDGALVLTHAAGHSDLVPQGTSLSLPETSLFASPQPQVDFPFLFRNAPLAEVAKRFHYLSLVPLCTDRGMLGMLLVARGDGDALGSSERRLLGSLVDAAENAMGRAIALQEMQARMREEAASRAKSEFLAVMSHELRTPLTAILGFTELLAENQFGPTNERQQEYLQEVLSSARHLLSLINDTLDLAKVESGKLELTWDPIDSEGLLRDVLRSFSTLAHRKGLTLLLSPPATGYPSLVADSRRLKQILYNLVSNAVKFTDNGGEVRLDVECGDDVVIFKVTDTGIGIPRAEQEKIFKPFGQASRPPGRAYEGTGLGLSLSLRLAELHGGTLLVSSEPGQGSTFRVVMPQGGKPS